MNQETKEQREARWTKLATTMTTAIDRMVEEIKQKGDENVTEADLDTARAQLKEDVKKAVHDNLTYDELVDAHAEDLITFYGRILTQKMLAHQI